MNKDATLSVFKRRDTNTLLATQMTGTTLLDMPPIAEGKMEYKCGFPRPYHLMSMAP